MELKHKYCKDSSMVSRKIADELILVPIRQNVGDLQNIYTLNEAGALIWENIDGKKDIADIIEILMDEYDVEQTTAEADVSDFLSQLESIKAIKLI